MENITEIHAHAVLRMMEGNDYASVNILKEAIVKRFGAEQIFRTCSVKGLTIDALLALFEKKGKFKPSAGGFTMDITKVCKSY